MNASAATRQGWAPSLRSAAPGKKRAALALVPALAPAPAPVAPASRRSAGRAGAGVRSCTIDDQGRDQALRAAGLRLTTRGRWAVVITFMVLVMVVAGSLGLVLTEVVSAAVPNSPTPTKVVQVQPGQTMWQIAESAAPTADVRVTVDQIVKLNGLTNAGDLTAGDYIRVPAPNAR
ncbi:LysM peptidoglycan-binding domain-containing protein [Flindersiella endophytica]